MHSPGPAPVPGVVQGDGVVVGPPVVVVVVLHGLRVVASGEIQKVVVHSPSEEPQ